MATYTLPDIVIKGETYSIQFLNAVAGLTTPGMTALVKMGARRERIDGNNIISTIMPENISLQFKDDSGFFFGLLDDEADVKITRNSSVVEFYGSIDRKASRDWNEYYVNGVNSSTADQSRRDATLVCVSKITNLSSVTADFVLQKIILDDANHPVVKVYNTGSAWFDAYVTIKNLFRPFLLDCLGVSITYADPVFEVEDFQYFSSDLFSARYLSALFVRVGSTTSGTTFNAEDYFLDSSDNYLGKKYSTALDLLTAFARTFGMIPRIVWDDANATFRLVLRPRRDRTESSVLASSFHKASKKSRINSLYPERFIFLPPMNTNNAASYDPTPRPWNYSGGVSLGSSAVTEGIEFDYSSELLWGAVNDVWPAVSLNILLHYAPSPFTTFVPIEYVKHWDYDATDWSGTYSRSTYAHLYYFAQYFLSDKEEIDRIFMDFSSRGILNLVDMYPGDGGSNKNYLINSFERDYMEKTETYNLIEI